MRSTISSKRGRDKKSRKIKKEVMARVKTKRILMPMKRPEMMMAMVLKKKQRIKAKVLLLQAETRHKEETHKIEIVWMKMPLQQIRRL